jgi:hypothetical protein
VAVQRYDRSRLDKASATPQGGLRIEAFPTRVGVFTYRTADGVRREYRPAEEVFKADSLASLCAAPVTDLHPEEGPVTSDNWRRLAVGHVAESVSPSSDGTHVATSLIVQDANMCRMIDAKERQELSCGYMADLDMTPGEFNGIPYDCIQRNIFYNHVALGPSGWGRQGATVALRLDGGTGWQVDSGANVMKLTIDGKEYDAGSAECQAAITKLQSERDSANGARDAAVNEAKAAKTRADAAADPKAVAKLVAARLLVIDGCNRIRSQANAIRATKGLEALGATDVAKLDAAAVVASSSDDLIAAAIKLIDPDFDANGKSPDYIAGAFSMVLKQLAPAGTEAPADATASETPHEEPIAPPPAAGPPNRQDSARAKLRSVQPSKTDANDDPETKARADSANAWTQPLAQSKA